MTKGKKRQYYKNKSRKYFVFRQFICKGEVQLTLFCRSVASSRMDKNILSVSRSLRKGRVLKCGSKADAMYNRSSILCTAYQNHPGTLNFLNEPCFLSRCLTVLLKFCFKMGNHGNHRLLILAHDCGHNFDRCHHFDHVLSIAEVTFSKRLHLLLF